MLTLQDLHDFAEQNEIIVTGGDDVTNQNDDSKSKWLSLWMNKIDVDAWFTLMTSLTEVPIRLYGTRSTSGSLHREYVERLDEVEDVRKELGLRPVFA